MSFPILTTKLYIPPHQSSVVVRPRLIEQLHKGLRGKLTLISAPAGFGKTTVVSEWVATCERPVAWLSLDGGDSDPVRFGAYLVAALQTIFPDVGSGVLQSLQSPEPPPVERMLMVLLNEITTIKHDFILILDDYHLVDARPVDQVFTFLLEHLPPQMHVVVATREDPNIPVARLRVRGELTELRAPDLRFSSSEIDEFLNQVMELNLTTEAIDTLEMRTEGWIAGLHLAGISLRGQQDPTRFITSFSGSHHFVVDYLVEEVLHRQPAAIQDFLLFTSILNRLCGPLCDAILPQSSPAGQNSLEYLERANLLLVPLDDKRKWYRYHHLFSDVLQVHLTKEKPEQVVDLHLRACAWYEQNNFRPDAIEHALAAQDFTWAADLIEQEWLAHSGTYFRSATWMGWVRALPDELVRTRVTLSLGLAWTLLFSGELQAAEARMRDTSHLLDMTTSESSPPLSTSTAIRNNEEFQSLRALFTVAQAFHAQARGDVAGTAHHARQALTLIAKQNYYLHGLTNSLLGLACWTQGHLEMAFKHMSDAMANLRMAGSLLFATSCAYILTKIRTAQGRLFDATNVYEEALQFVIKKSEPGLPGTADLHLGLGMLYREQGKTEAAKEQLLRCEALGKQAALPEWPYELYLAQARIKEEQGELDDALRLLEEAEHLYQVSPVPNLRPVEALKARIWIRQGKLEEATAWVRARDISIEDELSYLHEFEYITLARVLIASYRNGRSEHAIHEALELLERLLKAAQEGERAGSVIEILIVQALAYDSLGDISAALVPLQHALILAEPEGYVRVFVDEGIPMAQLLSEVAELGMMPKIAHKLLAVFGAEEHLREETSSLLDPQPQIESLSQRELEVLHLIAQGLSNHEIAERLFLALSTIKGHNQRIFGKLQVQRRTEAIARAQELGLL